MLKASLAAVTLLACERVAERPDLPSDFPPPTPAALQSGEMVFERACAECHGASALGTEQGPPLVHAVYRPDHHADQAFILAVRRGVRAHHWAYGDMPPVADVTDADVALIVLYVRWLQRMAGIE